MKTKYRKNGYSRETALNYIDEKKAVQSLSTELETRVKFEDGNPTDEIDSYRAWFSQEGAGAFEVKFFDRIYLPKYMSIINFYELEACEVGNDVYFRAQGIEVVK